MTERWVFNASPLILLGKTAQLEWLPRLGEVIIPAAVADEVLAGRPDDPARKFIESSIPGEWIREVTDRQEVVAWDLGPGETAVISWAMEGAEYEAVLDDAAARRCCDVFGVRVRGTLSLVALAKKRGWVKACRPVFALLREAGLYVSPDLLEQVAKSAGE